VWDYQSSYKLSQWKPDLRNHNLDLSYRSAPHLSVVELINSHDVSLILAGYNDGNIQVWSQFIDGPPKLVSGWHALPICKSPSFESSSSKRFITKHLSTTIMYNMVIFLLVFQWHSNGIKDLAI
jgi:hypothetical protein